VLESLFKIDEEVDFCKDDDDDCVLSLSDKNLDPILEELASLRRYEEEVDFWMELPVSRYLPTMLDE